MNYSTHVRHACTLTCKSSLDLFRRYVQVVPRGPRLVLLRVRRVPPLVRRRRVVADANLPASRRSAGRRSAPNAARGRGDPSAYKPEVTTRQDC